MPQPRRAGFHTVVWATLLLATALSAPAALAATATDDQAQAVERELHDWLQGLLGTAMAAPERPVQLRAEGGNYAVIIPLGADSAITGHLTPQDDGRWLLSGVKLPSPASFTLSLPIPTNGGPANGGQPSATTTRTYEFSVARQDTSGVLDPTYKTPSSLQQRYEGFQLNSSGADGKQSSQTAHSTSQTTLTPAADDRFDLASSAEFDGYLVDNQRDNGFTLHLTAERGRAVAQLSGISPDKGPALLRNWIGLAVETVADVASANGPSQLTPEQQAHLRTGLRALLDSFDGFASSMQADYVLEGAQVQAAGFSGIARRATVGFGGDAPDGVLNIYLDLGVEGISVPGLLANFKVPPRYADLVPTDIHVRPTLAGVGTKELLDLGRQALDAIDQGQHAPPDPAPLFAHGGVVAGLDAVSFNVGPTNFAGRGTVTFTAPAPDAFTGQGKVTATNLDALIDRAKQDPTMQQALPVLTIAKGIGRASGDKTVWDITYQDGKALVNGVDVMAMAGASAGGRRPGGPQPAVRTPPAPAPRAPAPPAKPPPK